MPRGVPQVAQCEDYDSDECSTKPGTKMEARRKTTAASRPPKAIDRYRAAPRDIASDSGYSSHASGTPASNVSPTAQTAPAVQAPPSRPVAPVAPKPKPVLHRSESLRGKDKPPSRSSSKSGRREPCNDLNCQHASCQSARPLVRRDSALQQYTVQYAPHYSNPPTPISQEPLQYQYHQYTPVQPQPTYQAVPVLAPEPRPRPQPASRPARPTSVHGYSFPSNIGQSGPPPSYSAYQNAQYAAWLQWCQQRQAYQQALNYAHTPITPIQTGYPQQPSSMAPSPTSPDFRVPQGFQGSYTSRPASAITETTVQPTRPLNPNRTYSTRQAPVRQPAIPGAYPRDETESSDSYTSDSSASEYSDDERERHYRPRARDSRLMSLSPGRRPSLRRQQASAALVPTRDPRNLLRRNPPSDAGLDYISSSDNMDSDRTARAVIDHPRRSHTNSTRSSRRPSVSTTASSGRTKATTVSNTSGLANVIVERNGRHITYLSKRDRDKMEYESHQRTTDDLEDKVRAYQDRVRGVQPPELTAQDFIDHEQGRSRSRSHFSGGQHSRKGSRSSSRTHESTSDAIRIVHGGNVVHLPPNTPIEMYQRDDGSSTLIIGSSFGRDSKYHSSGRQSLRRASHSYGGGSSEADSRYEETIPEDEDIEQSTSA